MSFWIHRAIRNSLWTLKSAPGFLLWSASAATWAWATRCFHAWRMGYRQGLAFSDQFLDRYPEVQREFREMVRATQDRDGY